MPRVITWLVHVIYETFSAWHLAKTHVDQSGDDTCHQLPRHRPVARIDKTCHFPPCFEKKVPSLLRTRIRTRIRICRQKLVPRTFSKLFQMKLDLCREPILWGKLGGGVRGEGSPPTRPIFRKSIRWFLKIKKVRKLERNNKKSKNETGCFSETTEIKLGSPPAGLRIIYSENRTLNE
jgi:hypothetical protein